MFFLSLESVWVEILIKLCVPSSVSLSPTEVVSLYCARNYRWTLWTVLIVESFIHSCFPQEMQNLPSAFCGNERRVSLLSRPGFVVSKRSYWCKSQAQLSQSHPAVMHLHGWVCTYCTIIPGYSPTLILIRKQKCYLIKKKRVSCYGKRKALVKSQEKRVAGLCLVLFSCPRKYSLN